MKEKEYAIIALRDILHRALSAVAQGALYDYTVEACDALRGWDQEFAAMPHEKQVDWLIQLFAVLIEHG